MATKLQKQQGSFIVPIYLPLFVWDRLLNDSLYDFELSSSLLSCNFIAKLVFGVVIRISR